eukprot:m.11157 g.11157  ORF g.11157 m.11157 type:complete len:1907 (-) comp3790_c0_seq1:174-5894(-)
MKRGGLKVVITMMIVLVLPLAQSPQIAQAASVGSCDAGKDICSKHGTCFENSKYTGCECDPGYDGYFCEFTDCSNHCMGQGNCVNGACECNTGYTGSFCYKDCSPGQYASLLLYTTNWRFSLCVACSSGYYQPQGGELWCLEAATGYVVVNSNNDVVSSSGTDIIPCPIGRSCPNTHTADNCLAGTFSLDGETMCTSCPQGYYQPQVGQGMCLMAGSSYVVLDANGNPTNSGGVEIVPCPAGYECTISSWNVCPDGKISLEGEETCYKCLEGTYAVNASTCVPCPLGSYQSRQGKTSCTLISAGYYGFDVSAPSTFLGSLPIPVFLGANDKEFCPKGYYCDDSYNPQLCPNGSISSNGAVVCDACLANKYPSTDRCKNCPSDTYNPVGSNGPCELVPPGFYRTSAVDAGILVCPVGFYCLGGSEPPSLCLPSTQPNVDQTGCTESSCMSILEIFDAASKSCISCPRGTFSADGSTCYEAISSCLLSQRFSVSPGSELFAGEIIQPALSPLLSIIDSSITVSSTIDFNTDSLATGIHRIETRVIVGLDTIAMCTQNVEVTQGWTQFIDSTGNFYDDVSDGLNDIATDVLLSTSSLFGGSKLQSPIIEHDVFMMLIKPTKQFAQISINIPPNAVSSMLVLSLNFCQGNAFTNLEYGAFDRTNASTLANAAFVEISNYTATHSVDLIFTKDCFALEATIDFTQQENTLTWNLDWIAVVFNLTEATELQTGMFIPSQTSGSWVSTIIPKSYSGSHAFVTVSDSTKPEFYNCPQSQLVQAGSDGTIGVNAQWIVPQLLSQGEDVIVSSSTQPGFRYYEEFPFEVTYTAWNGELETTCAFSVELVKFWQSVSATVSYGLTAGFDVVLEKVFSDISHVPLIANDDVSLFASPVLLDQNSSSCTWEIGARAGFQFHFNPGRTDLVVVHFALEFVSNEVIPVHAEGQFIRCYFNDLMYVDDSTPVLLPDDFFNDEIEFTISEKRLYVQGSSRAFPIMDHTNGFYFRSFTLELYVPKVEFILAANSTLSGPSFSIVESVIDFHVFGSDLTDMQALRVISLDTTPPLLTCPPAVQLIADAVTNTTHPNSQVLSPITLVDSESVAFLLQTAESEYSVGEHNITLIASDEANNTVSCTIALTVLPPIVDSAQTPANNHNDVTFSKSAALSTGELLGALGGVLALVIFVVLIMYKYRVHELTRSKPYNFEERLRELQEHLKDENGLLHPREIKRQYVKTLGVLGQGNWGKVNKGILEEHKIVGIPGFLVAVKTLKQGNDDAYTELMREAAFMAQMNNDFIVKLYGVCTVGSPILVIMEYCEHGSFQTFLKKNFMSMEQKLQVLCDAAQGMKYLSSRHVVHRDLACRNILLSSSWRGRIADFGMSRESGGDSAYYHSNGGAIPVRWSAPECLEHQKFSEKTDVWSFGIVCYETCTDGALPYEGMSNQKVWVNICEGFRLPKPENSSVSLYNLMQDCWSAESGYRPTFAGIVYALEAILRYTQLDSTKNFELPDDLPLSHFYAYVENGKESKGKSPSIWTYDVDPRSSPIPPPRPDMPDNQYELPVGKDNQVMYDVGNNDNNDNTNNTVTVFHLGNDTNRGSKRARLTSAFNSNVEFSRNPTMTKLDAPHQIDTFSKSPDPSLASFLNQPATNSIFSAYLDSSDMDQAQEVFSNNGKRVTNPIYGLRDTLINNTEMDWDTHYDDCALGDERLASPYSMAEDTFASGSEDDSDSDNDNNGDVGNHRNDIRDHDAELTNILNSNIDHARGYLAILAKSNDASRSPSDAGKQSPSEKLSGKGICKQLSMLAHEQKNDAMLHGDTVKEDDIDSNSQSLSKGYVSLEEQLRLQRSKLSRKETMYSVPENQHGLYSDNDHSLNSKSSTSLSSDEFPSISVTNPNIRLNKRNTVWEQPPLKRSSVIDLL